jgi:C4-dicarboxylate-specific signal transduction histidine kinase
VPILIAAALFEWNRDEGVAFIIDMTDRKQAEERLRESERRFLDAQVELAHVTRITTLGELTASIAHEVSQPLAAVTANAEACLIWLDRGTSGLEAARRSVEWIVEDGKRANEVIRRVRALAKKTAIEKVPLDVNDVVRETIALVQRELNSHGVSMQTQLAPTLPMILVDRVQLQQVIINLVMNGMEAMQAVADRPRELEIRSGRGAPSARKCDGLRHWNRTRTCRPAVQHLLHHQSQRHGDGTFDLSFDRASSRWTAVGKGK